MLMVAEVYVVLLTDEALPMNNYIYCI